MNLIIKSYQKVDVTIILNMHFIDDLEASLNIPFAKFTETFYLTR